MHVATQRAAASTRCRAINMMLSDGAAAGTPAANQKRRVLVLGGGWAGLSAARTLLEEAPPGSVTVTVLEATDQVGGRARSAVVSAALFYGLASGWFQPIAEFRETLGRVGVESVLQKPVAAAVPATMRASH